MLRLLVLLISLSLSGCATYNLLEAPPKTKKTIDVHVLSSAKSNPNTIQIYPLPESSTFIYVRGDSATNWAAAAGGVFGGAIAVTGYSEARDRVRKAIAGNERNLMVDMVALTSAIVDAKIKELAVGDELRVGAGASAKGTPSLSLLPYVVLAYVSASTVRAFVFVDAALKDESGSVVWETRFIATTSEVRTLVGDNGWSSNSGKPLRDSVAQATEYALSTAVRDFSGKLPRADARDVLLRNVSIAGAEREFNLRVRLIESNDKTIVFPASLAPVGVGVHWNGGIYSLPKESVTIAR